MVKPPYDVFLPPGPTNLGEYYIVLLTQNYSNTQSVVQRRSLSFMMLQEERFGEATLMREDTISQCPYQQGFIF